ncbi:MAG: hypothetical protein ACT4P3_00135 [Betaproteobacteria bacterium]
MLARFMMLLLLWLPIGAGAQDSHRQAVLRLVSIVSALRDEARSLGENGMLGIDIQSRMAAPECAELFQGVVSMRNVQAVSAGADDLVVRWHDKRELILRLRRDPAFALEVNDKAGPVCAVSSVRARAEGGWQGKLTPLLLDLPGMKQGPSQVFPVAVDRAPPAQPLPRE